MNKFKGMPFEKCWNCKNMQCKIQAVNEANSKVKQGNYYECEEYNNTLDKAWKECAGGKFVSRDATEQERVELAEKNRFNPIERTQEVNHMNWNDIRQLAKSYDISLKHTYPDDVMPDERESQRRAWRTKQELIKLIIQYEAQRNQ